jgi:hypothetical protein
MGVLHTTCRDRCGQHVDGFTTSATTTDQLFCVHGKDRLAGDCRNDPCDHVGRDLIPGMGKFKINSLTATSLAVRKGNGIESKVIFQN